MSNQPRKFILKQYSVGDDGNVTSMPFDPKNGNVDPDDPEKTLFPAIYEVMPDGTESWVADPMEKDGIFFMNPIATRNCPMSDMLISPIRK